MTKDKHPMRANHCKLCDAPFININGRSSTTCNCARDRPAELAAAQSIWDESRPASPGRDYIDLPNGNFTIGDPSVLDRLEKLRGGGYRLWKTIEAKENAMSDKNGPYTTGEKPAAYAERQAVRADYKDGNGPPARLTYFNAGGCYFCAGEGEGVVDNLMQLPNDPDRVRRAIERKITDGHISSTVVLVEMPGHKPFVCMAATPHDRPWREKWARYFEARAAKSLEHAHAQEPNRAKVNSWLDVAAGERACAMMIRSGRSVEELTAALHEPTRETPCP